MMSAATLSRMPAATAALEPETEEQAWQALFSRNAAFDDVLYYGVKTTGIFCKPSCASRRPLAKNVSFFLSAEEAQQAGFRACLRCKPLEAARNNAAAELRAICRYIEQNIEGSLTRKAIASHFGENEAQFERRFKKLSGVSLADFIRARRMAAFKAGLRFGNGVSEATYAAGFGSSSRVYEKAASHLGMTPATYARGGEKESVTFAISQSQLGALLIARTARGVCRIELGDDAAALEHRLRGEFPRATITRDDAAMCDIASQIACHIAGTLPQLDLPLDLKATAFQIRVWKELQKIPYGQTVSYSEVACRLGSPSSSRAVARACASNRIALAIPCHRVVRQGGDISGYRWGVDRKRQLLDQEKQHAAAPNKK